MADLMIVFDVLITIFESVYLPGVISVDDRHKIRSKKYVQSDDY